MTYNYTIEIEGMTFTGDIQTVTKKYMNMSAYMGGEDGYAYIIKVTDFAGQPFDMVNFITRMRKMVG